jgi:molybdenum cofactor biosynthesis enzyme MoaA
MVRPQGIMDWALFTKIADEAAGIESLSQITLTGLGEPLMDPKLLDRLRYLRQANPGIELSLVTNGSYLTTDIIDEMVRLRVQLAISLNAMTAQRRFEIMGLRDFDHVVTMCDYALKVGKGVMGVGICAVPSKDLMEAGESARFTERWGGQYGVGDGASLLHLETNWGGTMFPCRTPMTECCERALYFIHVLWDGLVSLCCQDAEGQVILGDLKTQTLREVFAGDVAADIRRAHVDGRRASLPLCATCTGA